MANEITVSATLSYDDSESDPIDLVVRLLQASVSSKLPARLKQNVGTSQEAINLGDVSAPGWAMFVNRDLTNFVELRVSSGGAKFAKLLPGEFALLRLGSGAQAPYAIADTAAVQLDVFILDT